MTWSGFTVDSPFPAIGDEIKNLPDNIPHINPASPRNYALASSGNAVVTMDTNGFGSEDLEGFGTLHAFNFACSTPGALKIPVACALNITANCIGDTGGPLIYSNVFSYNPTGPLDGDMKYVDFDAQATIPQQAEFGTLCVNYTFTASMPAGKPMSRVALELDNVITSNFYELVD